MLNVLNVRKQLVCQTAQLSLQTCIWAAWLLFFTAQNQCGRWTVTGPEKFRVETASTPVIIVVWVGVTVLPFQCVAKCAENLVKEIWRDRKNVCSREEKTPFCNYGEWVGGSQEKEF